MKAGDIQDLITIAGARAKSSGIEIRVTVVNNDKPDEQIEIVAYGNEVKPLLAPGEKAVMEAAEEGGTILAEEQAAASDPRQKFFSMKLAGMKRSDVCAELLDLTVWVVPGKEGAPNMYLPQIAVTEMKR